jgi:hypothetical protein
MEYIELLTEPSLHVRLFEQKSQQIFFLLTKLGKKHVNKIALREEIEEDKKWKASISL